MLGIEQRQLVIVIDTTLPRTVSGKWTISPGEYFVVWLNVV